MQKYETWVAGNPFPQEEMNILQRHFQSPYACGSAASSDPTGNTGNVFGFAFF